MPAIKHTPDEFCDLVDALNLTSRDASVLFGVTQRTVNRYLDGTRPAPTPAMRFMQYLVAAKVEPIVALRQIATFLVTHEPRR